MKINISDASTCSYKVLYDVIYNKAFSNISINKHLNLMVKNNNDRALAVNIIYGTLKKRNRLEKIFSELSNSPIEKTDKRVRILILLSLYQIFYLDKVPEYAIVNDAVNLGKFFAGNSTGSYINGILRSALRSKNDIVKKENNIEDLMYYEYGFEKWITNMLKEHYDNEYIENLGKEFEKASDVYIKVNHRKISTDNLIKIFDSKNISIEKTFVADVLKINSTSNIFFMDEFKKGYFYAQDISGAISTCVLKPNNGDSIIDLCAAPGSKSFGAAIYADGVSVLSCDNSKLKLDLLKRTASQLGLSNIRANLRDSTKSIDRDVNKFDKVICDVPCSGLGVCKRKPEILTNLTMEHIKSLIPIQQEMLKRAIEYTKSGGEIVYSTCTINPSENLINVKKVIDEIENVELMEINLDFNLQNDHPEMKDGYLILDPVKDKCDGFFMAKIKKH